MSEGKISKGFIPTIIALFLTAAQLVYVPGFRADLASLAALTVGDLVQFLWIPFVLGVIYFSKKGDASKLENDTLKSESSASKLENDTLKSESSALKLENDTLKSESSALKLENDTLKSKSSSQNKMLHTRNDPINIGRSRFDGIDKIMCHYVTYKPLSSREEGGPAMQGIGIELLRKIIEPLGLDKLQYATKASNWADVLVHLEDKADMVLTPLFQTNIRKSKVLFSSPVFYADIGIFVREETARTEFGVKSLEDRLEFKEAKKKLDKVDDLWIHGVAGEISGDLAKAHRKGMGKKNISLDETKIASSDIVNDLIGSLMDQDKNSDVVFMEVVQVEIRPEYTEKKIVNILKNNELLYPVCFAVARKNEHLLNYINLRLLQIGTENMNNLIETGLKQDAAFSKINTQQLNRCFVRKI